MNKLQKPLERHEQIALEMWMELEGLSLRQAAAKIGVSHAPLPKWIKGGGIHPAQRVLVLKAVDGYLADAKELKHFESEAAWGEPMPEGWNGEEGTAAGHLAGYLSERAYKYKFKHNKPDAVKERFNLSEKFRRDAIEEFKKVKLIEDQIDLGLASLPPSILSIAASLKVYWDALIDEKEKKKEFDSIRRLIGMTETLDLKFSQLPDLFVNHRIQQQSKANAEPCEAPEGSE